MTDERRWYAGVDWASESHHVLLTDGDGRKIGEKIFKHGGEGLAEMAAWLMAMSGVAKPRQIHIAIEVPHCPVVETLIERSFKVHAINPKQMDRFRDRFTLAGAKDDSRDAEVMASALRTDPRCFRLLAVADPVVIELREWSRIAEDLGAERNRLTNRLREQLWRYFPAMLDLESDLGAEWLLDLWETAPTPHKAIRIREATVAKALKRNRVRRFDAAHVLDVRRGWPPGDGQAEAGVERVRSTSHDVASPWPPSQAFSRVADEAHLDQPRFGLGDRLEPRRASRSNTRRNGTGSRTQDGRAAARFPGGHVPANGMLDRLVACSGFGRRISGRRLARISS
jgi:hypothetical protein